jgi:hypothetical protein
MCPGIDVREIAREAIETFPALDGDNGAAATFALRMLTKLLSERRKAGEEITEDAAQTLRARLFTEIDTIEPQSASIPSDEIWQQKTVEIGAPKIEDLENIISDTFHTSTDGSPKHIKYLRETALRRASQYLGTTDAAWLARLRFMKRTRQIIQTHIDEMGLGL